MRNAVALAVVAAGLAVAGAATGITYAATSSSSGSVHACANSNGTLRLLDAHGHCPKHFAKVSISERGPRGKTGKAGPRGPGARLLAVDTTRDDFTDTATYRVPGTGLEVEALCRAHSTSALYITDLTGAAKYEVSGQSYFIGDSGGYNLVYQGGSHPSSVTHGSAQVAFTQPAQVSVTSEVVDDSGVLTSELLAVRGSASFTVSLLAKQSHNSCEVRAQITPSG
jgi:hypothetical protein